MKVSEILKVEQSLLKNQIQSIESDLILFVVDSGIQKIYPDLIKDLQDLNSKRVLSFVSRCGEDAKSIDEFENGLNFFLEKNIHRNAHLIGIGGGAVTDLAGFIASTLLRGIKWSTVPTTLLAMVDASIGGKTGINSKYGKNLIGSFHMPQKVFINTEFLKTLPLKEYQSGLGEVIKYGMINEDIFNNIVTKKNIDDIILDCANYKNSIVINDFKESGIRQILNYGHTFGHAIEKYYQINHGEAVFWGMYLIGYLFEGKNDLSNLRALNAVFDNPFTKPPWLHKTIPVQNFIDYIKKDKKKTNEEDINLVLSHASCPEIKTFKINEIVKRFSENIEELKKIEIKNN